MKISFTIQVNKTSFWRHLPVAAPVVLALGLLAVTLRKRSLMEPFFVHGTYFMLLTMVAFWASTYLLALRGTSRDALVAWLKDNWRGLVLAAVVSLVAILAIQPALRVLADETNLLGVSKNLYFNKTADFATTGKWYYETYWNLNVTMDRRPALFPFLVSLIHAFRGYSYTNAFHLNAILIPLYVFVAYRLAKVLGGEAFGILAGAFVVAHPITLISARSGGFDLMAGFFALVSVKCFLDYAKEPTANRLALLWLNLCMLAHVRYEGAAAIVASALVLLALRMVKWEHVKPYLFVYAFTPLFALPRIWQTILKADDSEQPLNATLFGWKHLAENARNYFGLVLKPFEFNRAHSGLLLALGLVGCLVVARSLWKLAHERERKLVQERFAIFAVAWVGVMMVIYLPYFWGKPLHPASARLFVPLDAFFSLMAAWVVTLLCRRVPLWLPSVVAAVVVCLYVPVASEGRFINELTLTRQAAQTWHYFEQLHDKNIMVVTDRPGLFTVMDYGSMDLSVAKQGTDLLFELSRHLYRDMYVIQEIDLTTKKPLPDFEIWPDKKMEAVLEFQNAENSTVRISRMIQEPAPPPAAQPPVPTPAP
jgi:4-amino-4-deoxy-L-arabinose transferase-like glycosyltransferase